MGSLVVGVLYERFSKYLGFMFVIYILGCYFYGINIISVIVFFLYRQVGDLLNIVDLDFVMEEEVGFFS